MESHYALSRLLKGFNNGKRSVVGQQTELIFYFGMM